MKGSDFIFNCANWLYFKCHKINLNRDGSYIDSADWIKIKRDTINPINKKIINTFKDTHREEAPSNKNLAFMKSTIMGIWMLVHQMNSL